MTDEPPPLPYREVQSQKPLFVWPLVVLCGILAAWAVYEATQPPPAIFALLGIPVAIGVISFVILLRLIITVDAEALTWRYVPLWSQRIRLDRIASAEPVEYRPLRDHLGWGIRYTPWAGWAVTLRGSTGVRLRFVSGRRMLIGTPNPQRLADAINAVRTAEPTGRPG